jgi:glyceraldehyde 3-phosphate dehydrogenase
MTCFDHDALRYLLNYDTVMGRFEGVLRLEGDELVTSHGRTRMIQERDPLKLPWRALGIDVVIESTGIFTAREQLQKHLEAARNA